jgi:hypothetical protein
MADHPGRVPDPAGQSRRPARARHAGTRGHGDLHDGRRTNRPERQHPAVARARHRQGRRHLVRLRRGQDRQDVGGHVVRGHHLLHLDRPGELELPGPGPEQAEQRGSGTEPDRGAAEGHLQQVDQHVRDVHAHRQHQLRRGQGRCGHEQHAVRPVHLPGQLPADGQPQPGHRPVPGHRRHRLPAERGPQQRPAHLQAVRRLPLRGQRGGGWAAAAAAAASSRPPW